jgi:RecA-family ATPase
MRNLALSLATGRPFANIAPYSKPRRVVLIDFETRLRRLRKDINKMVERFSTDERAQVDENFLVICDCVVNEEPLSLSTSDHMAQVVRNVRAFKEDIVIIDTISASFAIREENSNSEVMGVILKPMARMAHETQTAILGVHHIGKGGDDNRV